MKKLMVTGGLGFIGAYLVDLALPPSHKATADGGSVMDVQNNVVKQ